MLAADVGSGALSSLNSPVHVESSQVVSTSAIQGQVHLAVEGQCGVAGIAGVTVRLLNEQGAAIDEALTDDVGRYAFRNLASGNYAVQEIQPETYGDVNASTGNGGGIVFENNLIGEIIVGVNVDLSGYDFCDSTLQVEPDSDAPPPIVPHAGGLFVVLNATNFGDLNGLGQPFANSSNASVTPPQPTDVLNSTAIFAAPHFGLPANSFSSFETSSGGSSVERTPVPKQSDSDWPEWMMIEMSEVFGTEVLETLFGRLDAQHSTEDAQPGSETELTWWQSAGSYFLPWVFPAHQQDITAQETEQAHSETSVSSAGTGSLTPEAVDRVIESSDSENPQIASRYPLQPTITMP